MADKKDIVILKIDDKKMKTFKMISTFRRMIIIFDLRKKWGNKMMLQTIKRLAGITNEHKVERYHDHTQKKKPGNFEE